MPDRPNQAMDQPHFGHAEEGVMLYKPAMKAAGFFHSDDDTKPGEPNRHSIRLAYAGIVDPWNLRVEDVRIEDIAQNLAFEVRYGGAARGYYVGQHSLIVASYFSEPILKVASLLHDGEEYVIKDMPGPIKTRPEMAEYKATGIRIRKTIFSAFGLGDRYDDLMARIKPIDDEVYYRERASFAGKARPEDHIRPMPAGWSERPFLREFHRWYKEVKK